MWNVILEKAFSKVKGSYENSNYGHLISGMRAVTGNPGFAYTDLDDADAAFQMLQEADALNYLMAASTLDTGDYN